MKEYKVRLKLSDVIAYVDADNEDEATEKASNNFKFYNPDTEVEEATTEDEAADEHYILR
ncbi:hypothetical protein [Kurthia sp. Dielmo]|uniref:hypothetical protein n=1 Tax=Kurthia sp. Dielmo TaxID=1033738 RepID=UPI0011224005|nr:hypothetical protein [Kurthia sp. Dielmo]